MSAQTAKKHLWASQQDHVRQAARGDRPGTVTGADAAESRASAILRPWTLAEAAGQCLLFGEAS